MPLAGSNYARIYISAKRYQLTDAGREVLARSPRSKLRNANGKSSWLGRLLSRR